MAARQVGFHPVKPGLTDHKRHNTHYEKTYTDEDIKAFYSGSWT